MSRKVIFIVGGVVVALVLLITLVPFLMDANQYRPKIESAMSSALGRKVTMGNIRLSIWSGGVSVDTLSISDDPAFNSGAFLNAKSVAMTVKLMPLIFSHEIHVTGLKIDEPQATLLRSASGTWNFSTLGATGSKQNSVDATSSDPNISVQRLILKNGTLFVGNVGANAKRNEYDQVNLDASDLSFTTQFPFELTAQTPGNGSVKLTGKAGPLNRRDTAETPLNASFTVKNLDLASTGFLNASSGIAGLLDLTGNLSSDGLRMSSQGKVAVSKLQLTPGSSASREPVQFDYNTDYELKPQTGVLKQGDVHIGKALARLSGTYNTSGETPSVQMKLNGEGMSATDLEAVLPAFGVILPSGASLKDGTLNDTLTISGPVNRLVTTGPVKLSNAILTGFDLGSKLGALSSFAGLPRGSDTIIQILSCDLSVAPEGIRAENINLIVPAIATLTGNGTIAPNHALDFKMLAHLSSSALSGILSLASTAGGQNGNGNVIPFKIQGTASNPVFVPDVTGIVGGFAKSAISGIPSAVPSSGQDLGKTLGGLFGKKN
jgi:AsmA protein